MNVSSLIADLTHPRGPVRGTEVGLGDTKTYSNKRGWVCYERAPQCHSGLSSALLRALGTQTLLGVPIKAPAPCVAPRSLSWLHHWTSPCSYMLSGSPIMWHLAPLHLK